MLIEIHMIQNHSPSNLNRDDLGAPKTCYFGGVLRSRISSQCIKRSIRTSTEFRQLLGGIRTRRLADQITGEINGGPDVKKRVEKILDICGIKAKTRKKSTEEESANQESKMLVYTTREAVKKMADLIQSDSEKSDETLAAEFAELIARSVYVPDMALSGRMLETDSKIWEKLDKRVEAALQVAHAISTHEARPEVDYYVAKDDIPGEDAGAAFVDEAMYASACFYKYFSIDWEQLCVNLKDHKELAAHTVGAFLRAAAIVTPTGKQNSFAAHNYPDGIFIELRNSPLNYANAFAKPVVQGERDLVSQSIFQLGHYIHNMDVGYSKPEDGKRFWFAPNLQYRLRYQKTSELDVIEKKENNIESLDTLVESVIRAIGFDWKEVQKAIVNKE